jgi:ketosteroid isomerase-like protein
MLDSKVAVVQAVYEAFGRGDVATILEQLTDDVDWSAVAVPVAPWHGVCRGKAEVPRFFRELGDAEDVTEFTPLAFTESGDDVMVAIRYASVSRRTGKVAAMIIMHWWRFRGDKICFYRGTEDTAQTAAQLASV